MSPAAVVLSAPAAPIGAPSYLRRRPEDTVLYRAVELHLAAFLDFARERSGHALPRYVEQAFRKYLDCGRLDRGKTVTY